MIRSLCVCSLFIALSSCYAPNISIPADGMVNRIEIFDGDELSDREPVDIERPTKTISDPLQISRVLAFLRGQNKSWSFPFLTPTPGHRYTASFYNDDEHQFVIWFDKSMCGRNGGEGRTDNRCRDLSAGESAELKRLLEVDL
jgi:hypothetical protein